MVDYTKNVIARELLPRAAHLKLVGVEISEQGWVCSGGGKQLCRVSQLRYEVQISP